MRFRQYLVLGVLVYLLVVLAHLPAASVLPRVLVGAPGVEFGGLSGSIWDGQAASLRVRGAELPALSWRLGFWSLLRGRAVLDFELGTAGAPLSAQGRLALGLGRRMELTGVDLRLPAGRVGPHLQLPGFELGGEFSLHLDRLVTDQLKLEALAGVLTWQQAEIKSPYGQARLGSQAVHLAGTPEGGIQGVLSELEGPMDLRGEFHWQPAGAYLSEGSVREQLPPELARFFQFVGRPDGQGRIRFRYQGQFRP